MKTLKQILEGEVIKFPVAKKAAPAEPDSKHFSKWHKESVGYHGKFEGRSVTTGNAYEHYYTHAEKNDVDPMSAKEFHHHMSERGHVSALIAGKARYVGLGMKYEHEA
jgi:hypothetical protein